MHRFFINKDQIVDEQIEILDTDVKHIRDVLRLRLGDEIQVVCDTVNYTCEIYNILKDKIILNILNKVQGCNEPPIDIILYQGLTKGSKMDLIVQKGTEVGIKEFYPLATSRSVVKIKEIKKEKNKVERWNVIAEEAAKQSKRDILPEVKNIISFDELINLLDGKENIFVPYEDEKSYSIKEGLNTVKDGQIHLIIGPEGGFEADEIKKLKEIGAKVVTLGPRILRTETAGLVSATIILYQLGDLGVI